MKRKADVTPEKAMIELQKIFRQLGTGPLEVARNEILQEEMESPQVRQALRYFMTRYWHDLARPTLLSLVCESIDGDPRTTAPYAVSLTLISGAIDIHDDIIDQSKTKDGRPTVYGKYGKDLALLVGDALLFKGLTLLNTAGEKTVSAKRRNQIIMIVKDMFFELGNAEALELQFRNRIDVTPEKYLEVVRKKAADVDAHTRIGAIIGGGSARQIEAIGEYGRLLGTMIILRDDWLDLADPEESLHRIRKECLPLPMLYGLQNPQTRPLMKPLLAKDKLNKRDAEAVLNIIKRSDVPAQYEKLLAEAAENSNKQLAEPGIEPIYLSLFTTALRSTYSLS